ncbi:hypothetical protein FA13DRAFT_1734053 [Coprinellus micaceus]|uniref:Uncharacterized protein n=1 Tax=Coprinellus micaceus TaxID=71717 RepID=A0A4Y7T7S2_COPMI|nr:hypothetical protein FA13DRAFT_1734053 [Coprinellus micaceus]
MSATSTPNDSPAGTPIQPLHNPAQAAKVVVPKAPLNKNVVNNPEMGAKALLAKRMAKSHNPAFISPTDNLMTPVTQKLAAAKKKQFAKGTKPVQLFATQPQSSEGEAEDSEDEKMDDAPSSSMQPSTTLAEDDENPF